MKMKTAKCRYCSKRMGSANEKSLKYNKDLHELHCKFNPENKVTTKQKKK